MAKAKFMNGEFSAKFKGKRKFVAEQMEAIKDYAARDDMQINICPVIQERPSEKKNTEEQITPTHFISGNLEHAVVAIYDNAGIPSFMHRFYVYEPKKRMIMSIKFKHRVVQWAIYRVINPM